jgi:hypothetical protein
MDHKLTLKLDDQVIEKAKQYARQKNTSLSKLIEAYLEYLTTTSKKESEEITPLVKSLSGIVNSSKKTDYKKEYKNHILNKYAK